jgi:Tfp pilus assembly protein PilX
MLVNTFFEFSQRSTHKSQSGQIAVIVFLIMAILLVVGLSLASRTAQEVELAGQQEDTTRVFNAAESGIEEALSDPSNFDLTGTDVITETVTLPGTSTTSLVTITPDTGFENTYEPGQTATVFTNPVASSNVTISWSKTTESDCSVLVVTAYTNDNQAYHYGIRPNINCHTETNFLASATSIDGIYRYKYTISLPANTVLLRIKPLYNSTSLKVEGSDLAPQNHTIRSQAQDLVSGNTEVRAIEVNRSRPAPPSIFDYALYSGNTLTK